LTAQLGYSGDDLQNDEFRLHSDDNDLIILARDVTVRKIDRRGYVSTYAGSMGSEGKADGIGDNARFNKPEDVVVDSKGNVFVADTYNFTIRKITPNQTASTFAGAAGESGYQNGDGSEARFNKPIGIAIDGKDHLYVADSS
jgi:sugar lactone lactonase YvrE